MTTPPPLELAERAFDAAGGKGIATVSRERSLMLRYGRSRPTQATAIEDLTVEVALLVGGHVGRATTNRVDPESLSRCVTAARAAAEAAARAEGEGEYTGFPAAGEPHAHEGHDPETARLDPGAGGEALAAAFAAAGRAGVEAHGTWTAGEVETALVSEAGAALRDRVTDAFMKTICIAADGRSGYHAQTASAISGLDPAAIAEQAAAKAAAPGEEAVLDPGEHTVVMEPHAVGLLLEMLASTAFNGLAHAEGRGALAGRLGTSVASPRVNLSDSPRYHATLPRAFDAEGTPKAPLPLIQDGVAHRVVHDTRSAAHLGASSTGHALAAGGAPGGALPTNLVLIGGGAADVRELCAPVKRGIYVTRLWYANAVRPAEALVTATTRDGTFLIEDGEVTRPLADVRLTDSVLGILARTSALSARPLLTSDGELYGRRFANGVVCPALRAEGVRFTGGAPPG